MKEFAENEMYEKMREKVFFYVTHQKRTEFEIKHKVLPLFKKYNISEDLYYDLIEELKVKGYINDVDFVKRKFLSCINFKILSIKEIEYKLLKKGISKEQINEYIEDNRERLYQHEIDSAKRLYEKKIVNKTDEEVRIFLRRKGYSEEIVKQV